MDRLFLSRLLIAGLGCGVPVAAQAVVPSRLGPSTELEDSQPRPNRAPIVRIDGLRSGQALPAGSHVRLRCEVEDPEGEPVTLRLLNPPDGLAFTPLRDAASPAVREATWVVLGNIGGWKQLVFEASDGTNTRRHVVEVRVEGVVGHGAHLVGDVTGDGLLDLVVGASQATVDGVAAAGAVYVWPGATTVANVPSTTLALPDPTPGDQLGLVRGPGIQLVDVTGDGVLDVVVGGSEIDVDGRRDVGAIAIWEGGARLASGTPSPWILSVEDAKSGDALASTDGLSIVIEDLTGDGIRDLAVGSRFADVFGMEDRGAIYLFEGGAAALAKGRPYARLVVPDTVDHELRGRFAWLGGSGQGILIEEVTGDGLRDVVAVCPLADSTEDDAGALYVWHGERPKRGSGPKARTISGSVVAQTPVPALRATRDPDAVLVPSGADVEDAALGLNEVAGVRFADVIEEGTLDIIAAAPGEAFGSARGAIYVWRGGPTLTGTLSHRAKLRIPNQPVNARLLGSNVRGQGLLVGDVTGDGRADIVAPDARRDRIYVWRSGTTLNGQPAPRAELSIQPSFRELGALGEQGQYLVDLNADGVLDIVSGQDTIGIWFGGPGLSGTEAQDAKLLATISFLDLTDGHNLRFEDVTADGVPDVVLCASTTDSLDVWDGTGLSGDVPPTATYVGTSSSGGGMGLLNDGEVFGQGFFTGDVTGDGVADAVTVAPRSSRAGLASAGQAYVLPGADALSGTRAPSAVLARRTPSESDQLGEVGTGQGLLLADLDDSGVLDVVVAACFVDEASREGRVWVWTDAPSGDPAPAAAEWSAGGEAGALLGFAQGPGLLAADLTGDGRLELVVGAQVADGQGGSSGVRDAGAVFLGSLGPAPSFRRLAVPAAVDGDQLGG